MGRFNYSHRLVSTFPFLAVAVFKVEGVTTDADVTSLVDGNLDVARAQLQAAGNESQLAPIRAWRAAYTATGTNPTKYRMAAESILRRLRTRGDFPMLHPLVTLCNSVSARFAIPVAALDLARISGDLSVGEAQGGEPYHGFDGVESAMPAGEVTFKDGAGVAHARKWSHKQSGRSAVSATTTRAMIVAEAVHEEAADDLSLLAARLREDLVAAWPGASVGHTLLTGDDLLSGVDMAAVASANGPAVNGDAGG